MTTATPKRPAIATTPKRSQFEFQFRHHVVEGSQEDFTAVLEGKGRWNMCNSGQKHQRYLCYITYSVLLSKSDDFGVVCCVLWLQNEWATTWEYYYMVAG
jgi:hypothetical protein